MFKKLSIQAKLITALSFIVIINIISGIIIFTTILTSSEAVEKLNQAMSANETVAKLETNALASKRNMADFITSGDLADRQRFLESYDNTILLFDGAGDTISKETLLSDIKKMKADIENWNEQIVSRQLEYMNSPQSVDMARLLESSEENKNIWKKISAELDIILADLHKLSNDESENMRSSISSAGLAVLISLALTAISVIGASIFVVVMVSRPLRGLVASTNRLIKKDWATEITGTERTDEIGQMAKALVLFRDNGLENEKLTEAQKVEDEKRLNRAKMIEQIVETFREEAEVVTNALEQVTFKMTESSVDMSRISDETYARSEEVAHSAENAGNNVSNVSAATEELTASIQEISTHLTDTSRMAEDAKSTSDNTVEKMKELETSARAIGSVIQIISEIAEQTNLLALNATIEAARAGEAGKGFAVVASEVKNLANETANATEQVRSQIDRIQGDTVETVGYIEKISDAIGKLSESMATIAGSMSEQTAATQEISKNVQEASRGTSVVVQNIAEVSEATKQTQATSREVSDVSQELSKRSESLKSSIDIFISKIKSA